MPAETHPPLAVDEAAQLFHLLGEKSRLRLLLLLAGGEDQPVTALVEAAGQAPSAVSRHLALLRAAGIVISRREGHHVYYRLAGGPVRDLLRHIRS